jgi:shikimate dehydrogenase
VTGSAARVFALLGDPVEHSLSPAMQNAAFRALGLRAVYVALRCDAADVPALMRSLVRSGGGGNVTIPHKETALSALGRCLELAAAAGACNTFWAADTGGNADADTKAKTSAAPAVVGDNTDVPGVLAALDRLTLPPGPWLVAGTGGGARAATIAARLCGASVAILSRSAERRAAFEAWAAAAGVALAPPAECRVLINTTPRGLRPEDPPPIAREAAPDAAVAFDMVYARGETAWVRAMRAAGLRAADGREMLVAQGAAALERWFPEKKAPVEVMRAAVAVRLR